MTAFFGAERYFSKLSFFLLIEKDVFLRGNDGMFNEESSDFGEGSC
jgi:hypothetical protein